MPTATSSGQQHQGKVRVNLLLRLLCVFGICCHMSDAAISDIQHQKNTDEAEEAAAVLRSLDLRSFPKASLEARIGRRLQGQRFVVYGAGIALSSLYCGGWSPILEYGCSGGGEFVDLEIASVDGVAESRILCGPSNGGGRCILPPGEPTRNRPSENLGVVVAFACVGTTTSQFAAFSRALGQGLRCTSTGSNFNAAVLLASLQYANSGQASSSAVTCRSGSYNSNGFCSDDDACIDFGTSGVCSVPLSTVEAVVRSIPSSFIQDCSEDTEGTICGSPPTPRPTPRPTRPPTPRPTRPPTPRPTPSPTPRPTVRPTPGPMARPTLGRTPGPAPEPTQGPGPSPPPASGPTPPPIPSQADFANDVNRDVGSASSTTSSASSCYLGKSLWSCSWMMMILTSGSLGFLLSHP